MKRTIVSLTNHDERMKAINKMKKRNKIIFSLQCFIIAIMVTVAFITLLVTENYIKNTYQKDGLVIYTNDETSEIAVVTIDCNEWSYYDDNANDEIKVNDTLRLTFFNNNTDDDIYDDVIIKAIKIK